MVGSGAVGGVFTPTLLLGALLGDAFGSVVHYALPAATAGPKAYALVGMGCLLAGTTHAPISAVLMLFEMTLDYNIVLPLLLGSAAASLVARSLDRESIYTEALRRKRGVPGVTGEAAVMQTLTVSDVMRADQSTVPAGTPLPALVDRFIRERRNHLYVVDGAGGFLGAVSLYEASRALREAPDPNALRANDVANPSFQTTVPSEHLDRTLDRFWVEESERLPVLESETSRRVVGTVSKRDILGVYSLEVLHRRSLLARFELEDDPARRPVYVELPGDHSIDEVVVPAPLVGRTFAEARFRERFGLSVLVLRRVGRDGKVTRLLPEGTTRFEAGDRIIVFGARDNVETLEAKANASEP
jgi:CBS domain-containing protein